MYLLDTDFIIASRFGQESTHKRAAAFVQKFLNSQESFLTDLVLIECATVMSRKYSQTQAIQAVQTLRRVPNGILSLEKADEVKMWQLFESQEKRGTSVVDCSNVVLAQKLGCQIVSFDGFYKQFDVLVDIDYV